VESQALGARSFEVSLDQGSPRALRCHADGLREPGPIALALAGSQVPELRVDAEPMSEGWAFRWTALATP